VHDDSEQSTSEHLMNHNNITIYIILHPAIGDFSRARQRQEEERIDCAFVIAA